jgi:peptidoglycan/xylan/chitin deacetylase (PgdA/CDA1 family)
VVVLTFDDGPCHPYTEQLLEILDREGVKATFFQIGNNVRRGPNLAAEVASRHVFANHTYDHPHLVWSRPGTIGERLQRGQEAIHDATATLPRPCSAYRTGGTAPRSSRRPKNSASDALAGR